MRCRPAGPVALAALLAAALVVSACGRGRSETSERELRQELQAHLEAYLPALAQAYETGDVTVLEGLAAPKEMATVLKRVGDLRLEGRILQPTFRAVTIEEIHDWNYANAFVKTSERWDLRMLASGSEELLSEVLDEEQRVTYQLKRGDEGWLVLYREYRQPSGPAR